MKRRLVAMVLSLTVTSVSAGDLEDGMAAYKKGNYATALSKYKLAAAQGDASAQFNLGYMYDSGKGVAQDYVEAVRWYRPAAVQGLANAQNNLGVMYDDGQGVAQDYAEAVRWYKLAAAQGDAGAQTNLGAMYYTGRGIEQDDLRAYMWTNLGTATGGKKALDRRGIVSRGMTPQQIAEAQKMARQCQARNFKNCD